VAKLKLDLQESHRTFFELPLRDIVNLDGTPVYTPSLEAASGPWTIQDVFIGASQAKPTGSKKSKIDNCHRDLRYGCVGMIYVLQSLAHAAQPSPAPSWYFHALDVSSGKP
jgi:hypothetical protein